MYILDFLVTQIFSNGALLLGVIAMVGLILQKKPFEDVLSGTVKTIVGILIINAGCGVLSSTVSPLGAWSQEALGVKGVIPNGMMMMSMAMSKHGGLIGSVVLVGFCVNLILARFTRLNYVALVGHLLLIWAAFAVGTLIGLNISPVMIIIVAGTFSGIFFWLSTAVSHHFMKKNENLTSDWALYIPEATGIAFTCWFSEKVGNKEKRCDDLEVSSSLEWMTDTVVGIGVIASIIWIIFGAMAGEQSVEKYSGSTNWILYLIILGFQFSAGLTVVLSGVRMMLAEIVPAFKGIATKVVPNAIPGLDYPTIFQFAPNAVFIGFIANLVGGILGTLVMVGTHMSVIVIPSVWTNFWMGSITGVFGDAYGGRRGAVLSSFIIGFVVTFLWAVAVPMSGWCQTTGLFPDYTDYGIIGLIYEFIVTKIF